MFKKIVSFFGRLRGSRAVGEDLEQQIELGRHLRDMLSVARKLQLDVVMTIEVGNQRQGVLLPGDGDAAIWLYNFACGEILAKQARVEEVRIKKWEKFRQGLVSLEKRRPEIDPEGP
jgi:hypothetical protein